MTDLLNRLARRTLAPHRGRRLVITLEPGDLIGLRMERCRQTEYVPAATIYDFAVKLRVAWERANKRRAKC